MSEFDQMQAQKQRILENQSKRVFDVAMDALRIGAPGLSDSIRQGIARSIMLRVADIR